MNVIADDRWIGPHGIGRFAKEVLKRIPYTTIGIDGSPSSPLDPLKLSFELNKKINRSNLFFSPGYNAPFFYNGEIALTIHDLIHLDVKEESSFLKNIYYKAVVLPAVRKSKVVFTVSQYSKNKIVEWANIDENKVVVVSNGVDDIFFKNEKKFDAGYEYFIYVGNQRAHKNTDFMIRAFSRIAKCYNVKLLVTGRLTLENKKLVNELNIEEKVLEMGFVEECDLPVYYKGASALIMPSLYEGFGLPIIEAMASGTLVLSSCASCLPEVAGDAALYFDPREEDQLVNAMLYALSEGSEIVKRLILGRKHASTYQWNDVARKVASSLSSF